MFVCLRANLALLITCEQPDNNDANLRYQIRPLIRSFGDRFGGPVPNGGRNPAALQECECGHHVEKCCQ